jgi:hypothetical protein
VSHSCWNYDLAKLSDNVLVILFCTLFIPHSPRWLLSKDREEDALVSLRRLRPKEDALNGNCEAELQEIRDALHEEVHKASWADLVRGSNLRRTLIVIACYFFQQVSSISREIYREKADLTHAGHWSSLRVYISTQILSAERLRGACVHLSPHQQRLWYSGCDYGHVLC